MRGELTALALLLVFTSVAEARVTMLTESPTRLASVIPITLVAGNTGSTTLGENHTSAQTELGLSSPNGVPPTLLWIESRSAHAQTVWLRVEPTSEAGNATYLLTMGGEPQVLYMAGIALRAQGEPVTLAPLAKLAIHGTSDNTLHGRLDLTILSHPEDDAGQTLHERWTVAG
ncbi:MAG: hypothetical protein WDA16_12070 [Candidatus Thermoplasmatota archaeon]